jgi:ABC-2 type transport system ATP-binding protein
MGTLIMQSPNNSAIIFKNVSLTIGAAHILKDISLTIEKKKIAGLLGPNGAGKTSLLSLVTGLATQSNGEITVLGQKLPVKDESLRRKIGVVLQETTLYEELTVAENLSFFASLYAIKNPKQRINEVLELLGIQDRAKDPIHILSGGLKRRTAIARALIHNPELLVVDEPTLGVDVETRHTIWEHLQFLRSRGCTILISSNYLDEAQAICDTVSVLNKGKLAITDSPQSLVTRAGHSLDIECSSESAEKISTALKNRDGIVRIQSTLSGLSIFLKGETIPDAIVNVVLKTAAVNSFRFRPADLAEVFRTLELNTTTTSDDEEIKTFPPQNIFKRYPIILTLLAILILGGLVFLEIWLSQPR